MEEGDGTCGIDGIAPEWSPSLEVDIGRQGSKSGFSSPLSFVLGAAQEEIRAFVERLV